MKYLIAFIALIGIVSYGSPAHAQTVKKKESFILKAVKGVAISATDSAVRSGMKAAGLYDCPKGQKCWCSRKKLKCMYIDRDVYTNVEKNYSSVDQCVVLCLGKDKAKVKEGVDVK